MGRSMPVECEHGVTIDWGDFGGDDPQHQECPQCEQEQKEAASRFEQFLLAEVTTCASHSKHLACNCAHTVASILQRMRSEPETVYAWLARERAQSGRQP